VRPGRLAGRKLPARIARLRVLQGALDKRAVGRGESLRQRLERGRAILLGAKLHDGDHEVF
jgi:hypothetical protein